jgi:large subunit ribosomal protein L1
MDVNKVKEVLSNIRKNSKKRNFPQTFDLIINLQNLDLKRPDHRVDIGVVLDCQIKSKKLKIAAVIDHSISGAEEIFDGVIYNDELQAMKGDMNKIREITHKYDKFVVQANLMPLFAQILGRYLGPMGKMPSPKLGMVISPKTPLKELYEKLQKTVQLQLKKNLVIQAPIGSETESDDILAKNITHILDSLTHALPNHEHNIKNVRVKMTMSKSERLI